MFQRLTWCRGVETMEGWVRWLKAVCAPLRKPGPMSLSRVPQTLANSLAADPLFCGVLASLHLHLEHKVDRERVVEKG
jgi:hypothetical protein